MVNTRNNCNGQGSNNNNDANNANPRIEQLIINQSQLMQAMLQNPSTSAA
jgi:hypothetical protein